MRTHHLSTERERKCCVCECVFRVWCAENNKINLSKDQLIIKKCLKSYLTGKKYFDSDKNKAFEYFKQSLKYLNMIEDKNKYDDLLNKEKLSTCTNLRIECDIDIEDKLKDYDNIKDLQDTLGYTVPLKFSLIFSIFFVNLFVFCTCCDNINLYNNIIIYIIL